MPQKGFEPMTIIMSCTLQSLLVWTIHNSVMSERLISAFLHEIKFWCNVCTCIIDNIGPVTIKKVISRPTLKQRLENKCKVIWHIGYKYNETKSRNDT